LRFGAIISDSISLSGPTSVISGTGIGESFAGLFGSDGGI